MRAARTRFSRPRLSREALHEQELDRTGGLGTDPGIEQACDLAMEWLALAQDQTASRDGGVARHFSLIDGWARSYPETTGYIVPTMIDYARHRNEAIWFERARRAADWLVSIQMENGAFPGGVVDEEPVVPVTFNTGQILFGLVAAANALGDRYRGPMLRAADWLVETQSTDGAWRQHGSPFATPGEKVYDAHVAWALFETERSVGEKRHGEAGLANVRWALRSQRSNGFFDNCCLTDATMPLTHTIGYVLRGVVEAHRFSNDPALLDSACLTASALITVLGANGFLPGRLDPEWRPAANWACLTGTVQVAHCWLLLHAATGDGRFLDAGSRANEFVRRTIRVQAPPGVRGGVKGSYPVDGGYNPYVFLNWAAKFFVDANLLEARIAGTGS
jgi:hypothetical protein